MFSFGVDVANILAICEALLLDTSVDMLLTDQNDTTENSNFHAALVGASSAVASPSASTHQ